MWVTGEFEYPWDVACDLEGNMIITDETGRVQVSRDHQALSNPCGCLKLLSMFMARANPEAL